MVIEARISVVWIILIFLGLLVLGRGRGEARRALLDYQCAARQLAVCEGGRRAGAEEARGRGGPLQ